MWANATWGCFEILGGGFRSVQVIWASWSSDSWVFDQMEAQQSFVLEENTWKYMVLVEPENWFSNLIPIAINNECGEEDSLNRVMLQ